MSLQEIQNKLLELNVNDYTEKKNKITYLSWANAYREAIKVYPELKYEVLKDENGLSYFGDERIGYMVHTKITIEDMTREMWLPVMDNNNKAMKLEAYEVQTKYNSFTVNPMTMFDVNSAIMRCLTKNLAMFGLGTYIYAGEDLPEEEKKNPKKEKLTSLKVLTDRMAKNEFKFPVDTYIKGFEKEYELTEEQKQTLTEFYNTKGE